MIRRILILCFSLAFTGASLLLAQPNVDQGIRPLGENGSPLNFDFETGDLKDWKATGKAFGKQPTLGDTVSARRPGMKSNHQGKFWIGGYEHFKDLPTGALTSVPFKVTHPWASFLIGGGPHDSTAVELILVDGNKTITRVSGLEEEDMKRVAVELLPYMGKLIQIRLVDNHTGHWGHLNFDDFRFHSSKPSFPPRKAAAPVAVDSFKNAGLSPQDAARAMTVPEEFTVTLFAGEPDIQQPVALCIDDRGRLWVAEAHTYPVRQKEGEGKDRILIFEDLDGDGKFDKKTVFMEKLNLVSGLEVGHGGVWIGAAPYLMFVPLDASGNKPAGEPKILLDGWGYQDTHETLNTFSWGPDGWLWGCHGVFTHSQVGKPGTKAEDRVRINAGVWRYHPTKHQFDIVAQGTSNPWGLDFNDWGEPFVEACVIPHAFHIIPGARYHRQAGNHFNPHTYADIKTIADHFHYLGNTPHSGNNKSDSAGGGHAHCGTMIYLGGTWPEKYRNAFFMGNIHGRRLNMDILTPKGSGYVASHGKDFLFANDAWARFINFRYGPDGNVYLIDWYDKQACHTGNVQAFDRSNGRIYKIALRGSKAVHVDLAKATNAELIENQLHPNDWFVRHSRRVLAERNTREETREALEKIALQHKDSTRKLRGLWALHATQGLTASTVEKLLADDSAHVRGWAIRLAQENGLISPIISAKISNMAAKDDSAIVRREIASMLQRLPMADRWSYLEGLLTHKNDAGDHNLPLLYWYAIEPLTELDASRAMALASNGPAPLANFMARKLGGVGTPNAIAAVIQQLQSPAVTRDMLLGLKEGMAGKSKVEMPKGWQVAYAKLATSNDSEVRDIALSLATIFGDAQAYQQLLKALRDPGTDLPARQKALATLVSVKSKDLGSTLPELIADKNLDTALQGAMIRAMATFAEPGTAKILVDLWPNLGQTSRRDALATLASRPEWAETMLDAIGKKIIQPADVPAELVRQLSSLGNKTLDKRIGEVWGLVRSTPAEKQKKIADLRKMINSQNQSPNLAHGRTLYLKACHQCHTLYGMGGKIGPDLTGSNRANLDYILENMVDPSAVIPKEYSMSTIALENGRVVTGIVKDETPATLTLQTANELVLLAKKDIESRKPSEISMMPDNLLQNLSGPEIRDLVGYLRNPTQTGFLATKENMNLFFNGKDLSGWHGDEKIWRVEKGEIIGSTSGLKRNTFLRSEMQVADFRLEFQVKLAPDSGNSGVQFRSEPLPDGEMRGPQADIGKGWWGKLYEESGRGLLWKDSGDAHVKAMEWNHYKVEAIGSEIKTWINGKLCVDLKDDKVSRQGEIAFQVHSGPAMEVRFKDIRLEIVEAGKK